MGTQVICTLWKSHNTGKQLGRQNQTGITFPRRPMSLSYVKCNFLEGKSVSMCSLLGEHRPGPSHDAVSVRRLQRELTMFLTSLCLFCVVTLTQAPKSQPDRTIITSKPVSASLFRCIFSAYLPRYYEPNGPLSKASVMLPSHSHFLVPWWRIIHCL